MSHYLVGVIVNKLMTDEVEEILAPYDENIRVEPYISETKEEIIADAKEKQKAYLATPLSERKDYMRSYIDATTDEELYKANIYDDEDFDENGNRLSTYNPNSKWDWYSIGGRFSDNEDVKIKDFKLYNIPTDEELALYHKAWDSFNGKCTLSEDDIENLFGGFRMFNDQYYLDRYGNVENYIKAMTSNLPYAFVDKNGWHQKGNMGWFGCDDADQESINSYVKFAEEYFTDPSNQEKYIVWVDCHI